MTPAGMLLTGDRPLRKPRSAGPLMQGVWLALEAQQVMAMRLMRLAAGGPAAQAEAHRMVTEKMDAGLAAANLVASAVARGAPDGGTDQVLRMLRHRVRANRRRLTKG